MFPVEPASEFGRDDPGKFSVCAVDVMARGFKIRVLPTLGLMSEVEDQQPAAPEIKTFPNVIPHLRHTWHETRSLPYNGPMEEFTRKRVRNDYPLLRLMQLGMTTVRTPMSDVIDPDSLKRLHDWASLGFRFVPFAVGVPEASMRSAVSDLDGPLAAVEIVSSDKELGSSREHITMLLDEIQHPIWLSKITTYADRIDTSGPFAHSVSSGFLPHELQPALTALVSVPLQSIQRQRVGLVFQIEWGNDVAETISRCANEIRQAGLQPIANLKLSDPDPARANYDRDGILAAVTAASAASRDHEVILQCDTFEDVDRGYHPRHGFIDRRGNLRYVV